MEERRRRKGRKREGTRDSGMPTSGDLTMRLYVPRNDTACTGGKVRVAYDLTYSKRLLTGMLCCRHTGFPNSPTVQITQESCCT